MSSEKKQESHFIFLNITVAIWATVMFVLFPACSGGEKIDIVKYSEDPAEFVAAALAPANVLSVEIVDADAKACQATVPDHQLSLAIGNKGLNAKLAAKLTGWKIDIKPESGFYEG